MQTGRMHNVSGVGTTGLDAHMICPLLSWPELLSSSRDEGLRGEGGCERPVWRSWPGIHSGIFNIALVLLAALRCTFLCGRRVVVH